MKFSDKDINIEVITAPHGPEAIESAHDEIVASKVVVEELQRLKGTYDAAIIGCFADPGLVAAREIMDVPVVGLCEVSLYTACLMGSRFSVVGTGNHTDISIFNEIVGRYGLGNRLASVRYLNTGVLGLANCCIGIIEEKIEACKLGCAAFSGMGAKLTERTELPVIDGVKQAIAFAEMMAKNELHLSR